MKLKDNAKTSHAFSNITRIIVFLGVATLCVLITMAILSSTPEEGKASKEADILTGMPVSIRSIKPETYPAVVKSFGEVVPLWKTTIKSQVDGQVVFFADKLRVGEIVKQGELLVKVEKSAFEMQVADAKNRLASAQVDLLKEEREASHAHWNWSQSKTKGKPKSPLVLHKPQIQAARAELKAAQVALVRAQTLLKYTEIRAPFDGVVMQRMINQGETLFTGGEVAVIYGMDTVEVGVHLDEDQWALLPENIGDAGVRLFDHERNLSWKAEVVRASRHLARDSRLRTIFLQVKRPLEQTPPLLPGTFVQAEIIGRELPDLLCIPEPALTKQGIVWFVEHENRLQPRRLEPVFYGEGIVYINASSDMAHPIRVAVYPNSSFVSGLLIQPITDKGGHK